MPGQRIRRKALALDLDRYKQDKSIKYDSYLLKKAYSDEVQLSNYRHSLRLEGFPMLENALDLRKLTESERQQLLTDMKKKYTRQAPTLGNQA